MDASAKWEEMFGFFFFLSLSSYTKAWSEGAFALPQSALHMMLLFDQLLMRNRHPQRESCWEGSTRSRDFKRKYKSCMKARRTCSHVMIHVIVGRRWSSNTARPPPATLQSQLDSALAYSCFESLSHCQCGVKPPQRHQEEGL